MEASRVVVWDALQYTTYSFSKLLGCLTKLISRQLKEEPIQVQAGPNSQELDQGRKRSKNEQEKSVQLIWV